MLIAYLAFHMFFSSFRATLHYLVCSLTLKMEALSSSKMSLSFYQNIRRHIPEEISLYKRRIFCCIRQLKFQTL
jgi:hypothetical protein